MRTRSFTIRLRNAPGVALAATVDATHLAIPLLGLRLACREATPVDALLDEWANVLASVSTLGEERHASGLTREAPLWAQHDVLLTCWPTLTGSFVAYLRTLERQASGRVLRVPPVLGRVLAEQRENAATALDDAAEALWTAGRCRWRKAHRHPAMWAPPG